MAILQQDVLGLDVAMNYGLLVRVRKRGRDFAKDPDRVIDRKLLLALESLAE